MLDPLRSLHSRNPRQRYSKTSTFAFTTLHFDSAVVCQHYFLHQCQTEPGAVCFGCEEGKKDLGELMIRNSASGVFDSDANMSAMGALDKNSQLALRVG